MPNHTFILVDGKTVELDVNPDAVITEAFHLHDGRTIHAVAGEEEQKKLLALQKILDEEQKSSFHFNWRQADHLHD